MKASECIEILQKIIEKHGDQEICIDTNYECLWKSVDRIEVIEKSVVYGLPYDSKTIFFA